VLIRSLQSEQILDKKVANMKIKKRSRNEIKGHKKRSRKFVVTNRPNRNKRTYKKNNNLEKL